MEGDFGLYVEGDDFLAFVVCSMEHAWRLHVLWCVCVVMWCEHPRRNRSSAIGPPLRSVCALAINHSAYTHIAVAASHPFTPLRSLYPREHTAQHSA